MKLLKISEFARLRHITTESLRHYDRVGLLKPISIDRDTGYRYYSSLQSEKLSSILELKDLGFSIEEMIEYFDDRNFDKSRSLLMKRHKHLLKEIERLKYIEGKLQKKISHLDHMEDVEIDGQIHIKHYRERIYLKIDDPIVSDEALELAAMKLDNMLVGTLNVIAVKEFGFLIPKDQFLQGKFFGESRIIYNLSQNEFVDDKYKHKLPEGDYASFMINGYMEDQLEAIDQCLTKLKSLGYEVLGDAIIVGLLDQTVTEVENEKISEIQILVRKSR